MSYKLTLYKDKPFSSVDELNQIEDYFKQKIWMPPIESLNDPFEGIFKLMPPQIETIRKTPELKQLLLDAFRKNGKPHLTEQVLDDELPQLLQHYKDTIENTMMHNQFSRFGVFSFTDNPSNIPMWAYYANYHQGYCIVFELDFGQAFEQMGLSTSQKQEHMELIKTGEESVTFRSNDDEFRFAFAKVRYENDIPLMNFEEAISLKNKDNAIQMRFLLNHSFGIKFKQWEHESEYRLIANANSVDHADSKPMCLGYAPFIKVTGLILGKKLKLKNVLIELCKQYRMDLFQADYSQKKYEVITSDKLLDRGQLMPGAATQPQELVIET
jgi:hypothetical protein